MIGKKMTEALNQQIREELESAYIYLSMAAYLHSEGLEGMAHWMEAQCQEELGHSNKIYEHLRDRNGRISIPAMKKPKHKWTSALDAFTDAYKHEVYITGKINSLVKLSAGEKDNASGVMLQWFVTEQVEEEASTSRIVQMLERIGKSGSGLIMLDHQLGKRQ